MLPRLASIGERSLELGPVLAAHHVQLVVARGEIEAGARELALGLAQVHQRLARRDDLDPAPEWTAALEIHDAGLRAGGRDEQLVAELLLDLVGEIARAIDVAERVIDLGEEPALERGERGCVAGATRAAQVELGDPIGRAARGRELGDVVLELLARQPGAPARLGRREGVDRHGHRLSSSHFATSASRFGSIAKPV